MSLRVPPAPFEQILTIDFETYWSQDYQIEKQSTSGYVRDPRFQVIGVGVKKEDEPARWMTETEFTLFALGTDWSKIAVVASNAQFDLFILSEKFAVRPAFIFCTQQNQGFLYPYLVSGGNSVKKMAEFYKLPPKGTGAMEAKNKRLEDFTPEELAAYGEYCKHDCWLEWEILKRQLPHLTEVELWGIDLTVKMFTNPRFYIDQPLLAEAAIEEEKRKAELLGRIGTTKEQLMSNEKFAAALMTLGVDPPQKVSGTTGKPTWAFAKSDPGMKELLDDPDDDVRWLAEARVGVKSTIMESRIKRFQRLGEGGKAAPVFLKYAAAHTKRWGGADKTNFQNLTKDGALRKSLIAPKGYVVLTADLSQVEPRGTAWLSESAELLQSFADPKADIYCDFGTRAFGRTITKADKAERSVSKACLAAETLVLSNRGWVPISSITLDDTVWDGIDWVSHSGVLEQGVKEVWESNGVAATPDHAILTERGWQEWSAVLIDRSLFQSALASETWRSSPGSTSNVVGDPKSAAFVGGLESSSVATSSPGERSDVTPVASGQPPRSAIERTKARLLAGTIECASSLGSRRLSPAAPCRATARSSTTEPAASLFMPNGLQTARSSFATPKPSPDGTTQVSNSTALTRTETTSQETFASSLGARTSPTSAMSQISKRQSETFDLASSGPRNRFMILTSAGPMVVHNCVIGLGYQMGWAKFALQLLAGPFGADPITFGLEDVEKYGVDLEAFRAKYGGRCVDLVSRLEPEALTVHCAVAKFFVDKYRSVNRKITDLWKFCDYLLEEMVLDEAEGTFGPQQNFIVGRHKIVRPGGAMLYYPGLTGSGEDGYRYMGGPVGKKVTYIYGGKLVENLVQGFCRDILLEQMVAVKAEMDLDPVTTTHDELVYIVPEAKAEETLKGIFAVMATPPAWCAGMPLKATGGFGRSYYEAGLEK